MYNESIRDLLNCSIDGGSLELREDAKHGLVVSSLSRHQVRDREREREIQVSCHFLYVTVFNVVHTGS